MDKDTTAKLEVSVLQLSEVQRELDSNTPLRYFMKPPPQQPRKRYFVYFQQRYDAYVSYESD